MTRKRNGIPKTLKRQVLLQITPVNSTVHLQQRKFYFRSTLILSKSTKEILTGIKIRDQLVNHFLQHWIWPKKDSRKTFTKKTITRHKWEKLTTKSLLGLYRNTNKYFEYGYLKGISWTVIISNKFTFGEKENPIWAFIIVNSCLAVHLFLQEPAYKKLNSNTPKK